MTAQQLFESEPLWKRCRKFDKWQLIHFAESYNRHIQTEKLKIEKSIPCKNNQHKWIYTNHSFIKYCDNCNLKKAWSFRIE